MPPPPSYGLRCDIACENQPTNRGEGSRYNGKDKERPNLELAARSQHAEYKMILNDYAPWKFNEEEEKCFDAFYVRTKRGHDIACLYVKCNANAKYTILYSHPNAVDLGILSGYLLGLGQEIKCDIFGYDYAGYGCSSGKPNEQNIYADAEAAYKALREKYSIPREKIILYGQSIGSVPTIYLASIHSVAGVILHSAFMSAIRMLFPKKIRTMCDPYNNLEKVPKITSPVLVIHGTKDDIVKIIHGERIYKHCKNPLPPLWIHGAGHNDVERYEPFIKRLKQLVSGELDGCGKNGFFQRNQERPQ
ncbi:unnamed protein product [Hermetia illucens]|uniref:Protein ABHD13 n=2 Tax=Hermetia illucens TaxID=343691 RepID=A0A7R8V5T3_HERIL|nr:unnamed protein product [Hermetia illucens]